MRVAYCGNFEPEHSTENHVREALEVNGHEVTCWQENDFGAWNDLCDRIPEFDFVLWTRTGWLPPLPRNIQSRLLTRGQMAGVPIVGYHLDRWWGLNREPQVAQELFFRVDMLVTADGGHDEEWARAGVNHVWLPPAVLGAHAERLGAERAEYVSDVAFVGSWREYHEEWAYRGELVRWLMDTYGDRVKVYEGGVRGRDLADLYQSAKVIVGDSCLAGGATRYWSDRIPETLGRGGFLIHPEVEGLDEHFTPGEHLVTYELGDFAALRDSITIALSDEYDTQAVAAAGREHTLRLHTYERRMEQVITLLAERGMISLPEDRRVPVGVLRERINVVAFEPETPTIDVIWLSLHEDVTPHGYWDQGLLDRLLDGRAWSPPVGWRWRYQEVRLDATDEIETGTGGAVVVLPGRYHEHDVAAVQAKLDGLEWVVLVVTSDEESLFPWWLIQHPAMKVWVQYPDRAGADRYLPVGYEAQTPDETPADHPRSYRWGFAGQITHQRRQEFAAAAESVPGGRMEGSDHFLGGLDRTEYLALLSDVEWAPCPSGPEHQDTFRLWEALEAGCVPIVDAKTPRDDRPLTWEFVAPGAPFHQVGEWDQLGPIVSIGEASWAWPMAAASAGAWWLTRKRELALGMVEDVATLRGEAPRPRRPSDLVTAIVTVSPTVGHPDTKMIEETVGSIRDRLPDAEIILACDGVRPEQANLAPAYWEHLRRLTRLCSAGGAWGNVLPVIVPEHLHQAGATKLALQQVRTPLILFAEHDTPLIGEIPMDPLAQVVLSGAANLIRFHHESMVLDPHQHLMLDRDPIYLEGEPLLRTVQWSQRPHLASTEFYRTFLARVFGAEARTMIEDVMHGVVDHAWRDDGEAGWDRFRLWLYAPEGGMQRSTHLDGRQGESKFEELWTFAYDGPPPVGAPYPTKR